MRWHHPVIKLNTSYSPWKHFLQCIYVSSRTMCQYRMGQPLYKPKVYYHPQRSSRNFKHVDRSFRDTIADNVQTFTDTSLACIWRASSSISRSAYYASIWYSKLTLNETNLVILPVYVYKWIDRTSSDRHTQLFAHCTMHIVPVFGLDIAKICQLVIRAPLITKLRSSTTFGSL